MRPGRRLIERRRRRPPDLAAAAGGARSSSSSPTWLPSATGSPRTAVLFPAAHRPVFRPRLALARGAAAGAIAIEIDAASAFGTGEHQSTRGCLPGVRVPCPPPPLPPPAHTSVHRQRHPRIARRRPCAARCGRATPIRVAVAVAPSSCAPQRGRPAGARRLRRRRGGGRRLRIWSSPISSRARWMLDGARPGARRRRRGYGVLSPVCCGGRRRRACPPTGRKGLVLGFRIVAEGWSTLVLRK